MRTFDNGPRRFSSMDAATNNASMGIGGIGPSPGDFKHRDRQHQSKIFDDPSVIRGYESVPMIEIDTLPRGGISFETKAVGRIQFGIPPETIKDSMLLGMEVPSAYIVPVERFCREMGPALGINLAEFEFPAYFNYFVRSKRCTLVVDSGDAERDIRSVFGETLLGPEHFRHHRFPCANIDEDFDPSFPKDARPNFYKEFYNFRTAEKSTNYQELTIDTLLEFCHFKACRHADQQQTDKLGVPPTPPEFEMDIASQLVPPIRVSEANISDRFSPTRRRHSALSGGSEDEMFNASKSEESAERQKEFGPVLQRSSSDSSASTSQKSQSTNMGSRRNSMSSVDSGQKANAVESRRSSMPLLSESRRSSMPPTNDRSSGLDQDAAGPSEGRRSSLLSINSELTTVTGQSRITRSSRLSTVSSASFCPYDFMMDDAADLQESNWMYSQAKWLGEVATVYPTGTTEEQKLTNETARVEIFKMAGGTEYIIHDVDKDNTIVGKTRFSGTVRVPDALSVEGFISNEGLMSQDETQRPDDSDEEGILGIPQSLAMAPTFHPPSFGVTVLGNSHGFDKNGSTSGYVLWVNGRGIMIDPPPYSSATLEREGIRPQMIMAIIITHCHADHDAGAFQKVMTGSRVAIITTPTIYKSFIRKYSALSGLRQTLLRHSHRHRPAIIGQPLRFQGAVFHFTYTLHTIPCISFKVEWRGRSIVFTGDHMNIPPIIDALEEKGVLTKGRADDLRRLPIQECDVLLHEAGAPPIHTPLTVLQELPEDVKERLYVVHTAAIPKNSGLKVAPTGTAGTIRLDSVYNSHVRGSLNSQNGDSKDVETGNDSKKPEKIVGDTKRPSVFAESLQDGANQNLTVLGDFNSSISHALITQFDGKHGSASVAPLVFLRPTDVSDAWFILNLLSAVPFLSSLSYAHTMEILEIAHVEMYCSGEVVVQGPRRPEVLCVFWEGACVERSRGGENGHSGEPTVWHAGDWTGPVSLQPDISRSAHVALREKLDDIVAISEEGVKVITLMMNDVQRILKSGSKLFRKYTALQQQQKSEQETRQVPRRVPVISMKKPGTSADSLVDVIQCNSVLRNLTAMQKRYLESLVEGPRYFPTHTLLWKVGDPVDFAYIIVGGSTTLGRKAVPRMSVARVSRRGSTGTISGALAAIDENTRDRTIQPMIEGDKVLQNVHPNSEYARLEVSLQLRWEEMEVSMEVMEELDEHDKRAMFSRDDAVQMHRDRFANKVLARLYSRRAYSEHLIFSRGNFLSDTSRMVSGDLANINKSPGMGSSRSSISSSTVNDHHCHTSNLMAGPQGCVVMVFPRSALIPFLDSNPGVLLCLLGTQVVV